MQQVRESAHFLRTLPGERDALRKSAPGVLVQARRGLLDGRQVERQGGEHLRRGVMEFPRDTPPLLVLQSQQSRACSAQYFFGLLEFRNVFRDASQLTIPAALLHHRKGATS